MKRPRAAHRPSAAKQPRAKFEPESTLAQTPCWQLGHLDLDGEWGWKHLDAPTLIDELHDKLRNFETMKWSEILSAAGGRRQGTNSHAIPIDELCREAQQRLASLGYEDIDELFSLRLSGTCRLWGIREGRVLRVIWYDPEHQICPSPR